MIELLVVVAIIGVLAAIAIVNFMVALDKSKQKKSMADMRSIAEAWEARATDLGAYAAAGAASTVFTWPSDELDYTEIKALLHPTYIHPLAKTDGWGNDFAFAVEGSSTGSSTIYGIRSPGKDGIFESSYPLAITERFECDVVFSNGVFVVQPAYK